jgi:adenosylcobalamin-dependent ribonucleoside-triphosphate reductase
MSETPWGEIGYLTYKRTYARPLKEGKSEEFPDTVERIVKACNTQLKMDLDESEQQYVRDMMLNLKGSVAGRFLWQLGTKTVGKLGLLSLQNCATTLVNDPVRPFTWAMDSLMLGCGVGYNIQGKYVYEIPKVKRARIQRVDTNDADFIVPDSREGWVSLLERTLEAHAGRRAGFTYSTICVRGKGAPIKGFGGVASGPEELCWGIEQISATLNARSGKKLRPIDALDIMNIIGYVVVAGNVRRSAQIAIGDVTDTLYMRAKRWDLGNLPKWRAMSNNSVVCNDVSQLNEDFWAGYTGKGEPYGLINLRNSRRMGRTDEEEYPDPDVIGFNPCAEQSLADKETCCLSELYLPNITSEAELHTVASYLYKINKHSLRLKCHHKETEKIVHENMRMGIGVTGYLQATDEQRSWLKDTYTVLRELDKAYSAKMGWPESVKLTTVKPSGTLSLLAGVTPGCHPGYSQYFIRRVRISVGSPLIDVCRKNGYHVEAQRNFDGSTDTNTMVVEFPCSYPAHSVFASDVSAVDQLEVVKKLQSEWSDNAVSCTIYYKKEEMDEIKEWLANNYNSSIKTCSFLLHSDHGFDQAPFEEITKEAYDIMKGKTKPITGVEINENDVELEECATGACPIK